MQENGLKSSMSSIENLGIRNAQVHWNLPSEDLAKISVEKGMAQETSTGAITVHTGEFTGRSPKDRFIVKDDITADAVWWGNINIPFEPAKFDALYDRVADYLSGKEIYARDSYVCADPKYRTNVRVVTEYPWSNMFCYNMFLRPEASELKDFNPEWTVVCAPGFMAVPERDGTRQHNFAILNFKRKIALIGGTGYTGEMKKGIFSALNFILPHQKDTLAMHCSANMGKNGDTAIFFGLSGTGKTTLSADPNRRLIGDDEHGWTSENTVFNFEGGCYAKVIDLTEEKEPDIWKAIKPGALLENITFKGETNVPDYESNKITENTRVSYPIYHIDNIQEPSVGANPKNIFFLTCDASGVLPPISKLTPGQAMFHFISGYTAKVAGTEAGITEPTSAFSACFGAPFMPLHPTKYAEMLGEKMQKAGVDVWLINTGWSGGVYGVGSRIKLKFTRAMITAALEGQLKEVGYTTHEVFGLAMPNECPNVPTEILHPKNTWADKEAYDAEAQKLAMKFNQNFEKFEEYASEDILAGAPKVSVNH
ncbi:MAG: phosphoenolpyruvate carboxykinase (ATP) [Cytophagales bacterium CG12_big_fil_rev_8_21_14_0_65_40_12]|nr:MAG: phosphoenolpyruvate carboxykinase (ATP) [Cytophagales bacterium CG12_big_fil_rev_8_21_14_0_65_40_12]PIW05427.1 MAG: phosphoenolpyruvate carboxykinase (ATP) [Cytophagales bacterium CG17_big_fil_post_rev_8_21_14_2_50_40_13]